MLAYEGVPRTSRGQKLALSLKRRETSVQWRFPHWCTFTCTQKGSKSPGRFLAGAPLYPALVYRCDLALVVVPGVLAFSRLLQVIYYEAFWINDWRGPDGLLHPPILRRLRFVLEALLPAQPPRVGERATCANVRGRTVSTALSCTFLCSLNSLTRSIAPVRFSIGSHVASLMG